MKDCFRNFLISIFTFWLIGFPCHLFAQETTASLSNPNDLFWSQLGSLEKPAPVEEMSPSQIAQQQELNKLYGHEFVLSYSHYPDSLLFPENNYDLPVTLRRIDNEPITPYNWWWISLELEEPGGQVLTAHLRRPNWWIANNDAREIGNLVYLNLPEMAISGWSKVTGIRPSYIDTRVATFDSEGNYCYRPITGWFSRTAPETRDFFFSTGDTIGATPNHPFFSETRQEYVPAGELEIGEQVKLASGETASFSGKRPRSAGPEQVYNLEVWRGHNYHVGDSKILVHNEYDIDGILKLIQDFKGGKYIPTGTFVDDIIERLASFSNGKVQRFLYDVIGNEGLFSISKMDLWENFDVFFNGLGNDYWLKFNNPPSNLNIVRSRATRALVEFPDEYVNAIESFGIVKSDLFTRHGVDYGDEFFQIIENFKSINTWGLTDSEIYAIFGYTTNFYYKDLNMWLRDGINLDKTQLISSILTSGLNKLPTWTGGIAYRRVKIKPPNVEGKIAEIISRYENSPVLHGELISAGSSPQAAFFDDPDTKIKILINLKPNSVVKDISMLADGVLFRDYPQFELLFPPGVYLEVIGSPALDENGVIKIILSEL